MLSAKELATIKVAVELCNNIELKREILKGALRGNDCIFRHFRRRWNAKIRKKASKILSKLDLPLYLPEEVLDIVPLVGMRMLNWAVYHEGIIGFTREDSINFLKSSFFTQQGNIDNKIAAIKLMNDTKLSIEQKYKLACIYCFSDRIRTLYRQMTNEDKDKLYSTIPQSCSKKFRLVQFWSYVLVGAVDRLRGVKTVYQYGLEKAVESGSKEAVEYCLQNPNLRIDLVSAAEEAVRNKILTIRDWIVFRYRHNGSEDPWVTSDYYVDILCFLLSKMNEVQQKEFLQIDIEGFNYENEEFEDRRRSRVLEYFLDWPYLDYFMKTVELMWDFLPERNYAILLLRICDKIGSKEGNNPKHFEEKYYNYRGILKEFWDKSPERCKRYVFSNARIAYVNGCIKNKGRSGHKLLFKLLQLKHFTYEDKQNIMLILSSATDNEKENMRRSIQWESFSFSLLIKLKWEILDRFMLYCFKTKEQANEFKRELILKAKSICLSFVKDGEWDAAESFIKWTALPEEELNQYKRELIYTEYGKRTCMDLVFDYEYVEKANKICEWFFASEEQIIKFKKDLISSEDGVSRCMNLVVNDKMGIVDEIIKWCLSSQEEIKHCKGNQTRNFKKSLISSLVGVAPCIDLVLGDRMDLVDKIISYFLSSEEEVKKFKKDLAQKHENVICEILLSGFSKHKKSNTFKGGNWDEVEKFVTWCFTSEGEISDFKKTLTKVTGIKIHFKLIQYNQWQEAETFFAWLNLSFEEVKYMKKGTLFDYQEANEMFFRLMCSKEGDSEFVQYGRKQEAIELLLRWYLTDKKTVLEFEKDFKCKYENFLNLNEDVLEDFDSALKQRLSDLDEEEMVVKRKS